MLRCTSVLRQRLTRSIICGGRPGLAGRLRLQAAQSLLILGGHASYEKMALEHFELLAWVAQDSAYQVRQTFIQKLVKYIMKKKVTNTRYTLILFLTAHDPDRENILLVSLRRVRVGGKIDADTDGSGQTRRHGAGQEDAARQVYTTPVESRAPD